MRGLVWGMAFAAIGCSSGEPNRVPVHVVKGTVTLADGKPADGALVLLNPVSPNGGPSVPSGMVGTDGTFAITSYAAGDGAAAGEYAVTVVWPAVPRDDSDDAHNGPDRLKDRFADPKKPVRRITVVAGDNTLEPISLK